MASSSSFDYQDDLLSVCSSSSASSRRLFRLTSLGRPPGLPKPATFSTFPSSNPRSYGQQQQQSSSSQPLQPPPPQLHPNNNHNKTAPFKELEKMIADLKKENFDLKLRLFHMNWLEQENERLISVLDEASHNKDKEKELNNTMMKTTSTTTTATRSIGTQTTPNVDLSHPSTSYYTAFETSPEAFGLTPHRTTSNTMPLLSLMDDHYYNSHYHNNNKNNSGRSSNSSCSSVNSVERVADAFSRSVRIDVSSPNNNNHIRGWLQDTTNTTDIKSLNNNHLNRNNSLLLLSSSPSTQEEEQDQEGIINQRITL
ncbi:hypothetical protein BDA99DRAFT_561856 [Phascolomyces articulosus]|uniref:Centrosomin N-terminal motif 1 domain-containing protein n=1 Tax=Phascolomyces articulosus TaxID=60185 RepID=A0AAD5PCB2_9FUNG|nr:hypothetical protein BDA99DRAFT_561856 [Phascolomyces articulosus]